MPSSCDVSVWMQARFKMSSGKYESLVRQLYQINLTCAVKLGLENIRSLHAAIGAPLKRVPNIIHVAGTNGKGSVAFKIARAFEYSGLRAGLFVSPHISSFRERMQVNGRLISEEEVVELLDQVLAAREKQNIPATFFEVTTALAFAYFARQELDAAVIEVGLGGRLDATNIVSPRLSIITSVGLEHTKQLGDTIEAISLEKAGIIKQGVPVVVGPAVPRPLVPEIAKTRGAPVIDAPEGPFIDFDDENAAIAGAALEYLSCGSGLPLTDEGVKKGLASRSPCRFELVRRPVRLDGGDERLVDVVLDVGHNPPALARLFQKIEDAYAGRRLRFVLGLSADKDVEQCMRVVLEHVTPDRLYLVKAAHPRAAKPEELARSAASLGRPIPESNFMYSSVGEGVTAALRAAAEGSLGTEVVAVAGTFFIMADAREALGFEEPRDTDAISEVAGTQFKASQELFAPMKP